MELILAIVVPVVMIIAINSLLQHTSQVRLAGSGGGRIGSQDLHLRAGFRAGPPQKTP